MTGFYMWVFYSSVNFYSFISTFFIFLDGQQLLIIELVATTFCKIAEWIEEIELKMKLGHKYFAFH